MLEPTGEVTGVLRDAKGVLLVGVSVYLGLVAGEPESADWRASASVRTDRNGRFHARHLLPGKWTVTRSAEASDPVQVESGKVAEVERPLLPVRR